MAAFVTVELGDTPPRPLHAADKPAAGAKFGDLRLGTAGSARRMVAWHAETAALWVDADADGGFAAIERHTLGKEPLEVRASFPIGDTSVTRTLIFKRRGDGVAYAVRGYMSGSVVLGGKTYPALLTDGDGDGCFDSATADRVLDRPRRRRQVRPAHRAVPARHRHRTPGPPTSSAPIRPGRRSRSASGRRKPVRSASRSAGSRGPRWSSCRPSSSASGANS